MERQSEKASKDYEVLWDQLSPHDRSTLLLLLTGQIELSANGRWLAGLAEGDEDRLTAAGWTEVVTPAPVQGYEDQPQPSYLRLTDESRAYLKSQEGLSEKLEL